MASNAIVLLTHFYNPSIEDMSRRLRAETSGDYDIFIALNFGDEEVRMQEGTHVEGCKLFLCNHASLLRLPYPEKCKPEGWSGDGWKVVDNVDVILLLFQYCHPEYEFYWGVEYDVHYQGRWGFFFERFEASDADLLGTMLDSASKTPNKVLMPPFRDEKGSQPDYKDGVVGFFPIHRLSRRMLHTLDEYYRKGWNGHYEFTWGTIAKRAGMKIEDIGGAGPYVRRHNKNVFYFNTIRRWDMSPGTFVFRPIITKILPRENTLWHPVKPSSGAFNHCPALPEQSVYGGIKHVVKDFFYKSALRVWFLLFWRPATTSPCLAPAARSPEEYFIRQGRI